MKSEALVFSIVLPRWTSVLIIGCGHMTLGMSCLGEITEQHIRCDLLIVK